MKLLIYGSKSFARTVSIVAMEAGHEVAGFVDDFSGADNIVGGLNKAHENYSPATFGFALAIGYNNLDARWQAWNRVKALGYLLPPLVHPSAIVSPSATVLEGAIVMRGAIVDHEAAVKEAAVIWPGACINHNSTIGRNTFVSPGAVICGDVYVGDHCFVGANATIVNGAEIPDRTFVRMHEAYTRRKA